MNRLSLLPLLLSLSACGASTGESVESTTPSSPSQAGPSLEEATSIYRDASASTASHSVAIELMESTTTRVTLVDFGWTGRDASDASLTFHQKGVVLNHGADGWQIECAESIDDGACGLETSAVVAPQTWTALESWWTGLLAECEGDGESPDEFPGLGGSNACDPSFSFVTRLCDGDASACTPYANEIDSLGIVLPEA